MRLFNTAKIRYTLMVSHGNAHTFTVKPRGRMRQPVKTLLLRNRKTVQALAALRQDSKNVTGKTGGWYAIYL